MRIFYASSATPNADFASDLWRLNLYLPLVDLGHDVVEFKYNLQETFKYVDTHDQRCMAFIKKNRPAVSAELLRQIKKAHSEARLDLFFSYFYDACIEPGTLDEIRSMGILTVNWYCNGSYQLHLVSEISPHYDWCLVPEKFRLEDYRSMGARPIYCQEAANPNFYKPYDLPRKYDVSFIGQAYGDRPAYIAYLDSRGIDVHVWGPGWKQFEASQRARRSAELCSMAHRQYLAPQGWKNAQIQFSNNQLTVNQLLGRFGELLKSQAVSLPDRNVGDIVSDEEMVKIYSRSKINIGFSTCGNTHLSGQRILQVRLRDFEVPMSGGFYMVEYMEELEEFFDIGKEIVCYSSPEDLADKILFFLSHDTEREQIRQAGYERCRRDHSWHKRFTTAFAEMGLS
jgi:spore maturation protein CgeB